jgi:hypothetical protein
VRVFKGNTGDPTAFVEAVSVVRDKFGLRNMVMVGDRGMITSARIDKLKELPDEEGWAWLTCLRATEIRKLADAGPLQMSLFDQQDLVEIAHPDFPDERFVACRNPALAAERARKRSELLAATEDLFAPIVAAAAEGRLTGAGAIGIKLGKVMGKYKMAKHFTITLTDTSLAITRNQASLYDTGARVQELADLTVRDVRLEPPAMATLTGKGRKTRHVPIMDNTAALLDAYLTEHRLNRPRPPRRAAVL